MDVTFNQYVLQDHASPRRVNSRSTWSQPRGLQLAISTTG